MTFSTSFLNDPRFPQPFPVFDFFNGFRRDRGVKNQFAYYTIECWLFFTFWIYRLTYWLYLIQPSTLSSTPLRAVYTLLRPYIRKRPHPVNAVPPLWKSILVLVFPIFYSLYFPLSSVLSDEDKVLLWQPLLRDNGKFGMAVFWSIHYLTTSFDTFNHDYLEAWNQRGTTIVHVFKGKQHSEMHIPSLNRLPFQHAWDDEELLWVLKVHYGVFRARKGIAARMAPKTLAYIAIVKVSHNPVKQGERQGILDLGRTKNRVVHLFRDPEKAEGTDLLDKISVLREDSGLEFVVSWSGKQASRLVLIPVILSIGVLISWTVAFMNSKDGIQVAVQTGSTLASYIVTTGGIAIALIALLDALSHRYPAEGGLVD